MELRECRFGQSFSSRAETTDGVMVAQTVASWAGFSHLSYPIPGQGKWVKRVVLFFGLFWWGVGERGIYMEPVLVRTEEYVRCPVLLLFALSHTESFISSLNPELAVFR